MSRLSRLSPHCSRAVSSVAPSRRVPHSSKAGSGVWPRFEVLPTRRGGSRATARTPLMKLSRRCPPPFAPPPDLRFHPPRLSFLLPSPPGSRSSPAAGRTWPCSSSEVSPPKQTPRGWDEISSMRSPGPDAAGQLRRMSLSDRSDASAALRSRRPPTNAQSAGMTFGKTPRRVTCQRRPRAGPRSRRGAYRRRTDRELGVRRSRNSSPQPQVVFWPFKSDDPGLGSPKTPRTVGCGRNIGKAYASHSRRFRLTR